MPGLDEQRDTDENIIRRVREGDVRAFSLLVDRHKERGMGLAYRMLRSRQEAEEALQDAFLRAFRSLPGFELRSSFATWFYRIVYNVCATRLSRKGEPGASALDETIIDRQAGNEPLPDAEMESEQTAGIIRDEIEKLPGEFGTTFLLFAVHERSYEEIVEITGAPLGTVKARIFRARAMLRDSVGRRLGVEPGNKGTGKEQAA